MKTEPLKAYLAYIAICIVWGTTYFAIRVGVEHFPPFLFAGVRWIIAGSIYLAAMKLLGHSLPRKNEIKHLAIVGILLIGVANGLVVVAEQWIPSGLASLMVTTLPFWVVGLESLMPNGIKINLKILAGIILGFLGVFLILGSDLTSLLDGSYALGILLIFGAVISWSVGSLYSKYRKVGVHPLVGASVQMLIAGSAQTILGICLGEVQRVTYSTHGVLAMLYLVVFGSLIGYGSYIYALNHLSASFVSTYTYVNPVIALFLGWFFLNERLDVSIILSAVIILLGVTLVRSGTHKKVSGKYH